MVFAFTDDRHRDHWVQEIVEGGPRVAMEALYVVPNAFVAEDVRRRLLRQAGGWFGLQLMTFDEIVRLVIDRLCPGFRWMDAVTQRMLIARIMREQEGATWAGRPMSDWSGVPGVVDSVRLAVAEWKRVYRDTARAHSLTTENGRRFAHILTAYQTALRTGPSPWLDIEEAYWTASKALRMHGLSSVFPTIRRLYIDGFVDLQPHQQAVLDPLLSLNWVRQMVFMPDDRAKRWPALCASTSDLIRRLSSRGLEVLTVESETRVREGLADVIFATPPETAAMPTVRMVQARSSEQQWRWVAGRIRALAEKGEALSNVVIVSPDPLTARSIGVRILSAQGIPLATEPQRDLIHATIVQDLLSLLRLSAGFHVRDGFLRLAASALLGESRVDAAQLHRVSRERGWRENRQDWLDGLEERGGSLSRFGQCVAELCQGVLPHGSLSEHLGAVIQRMERIGTLSAERSLPQSEAALALVQEQTLAWRLLSQRVRQWQRAAEETGAALSMNAMHFAAWLEHAIEGETLRVGRRSTGVRVLSPDAMRFAAFQHVFIVGLNEGEWRTHRPRSWIFSEDAAALEADGVGWTREAELIERSEAMFAMLVGAAREGLYLLRVADSPDKLPSPLFAAALAHVRSNESRDALDEAAQQSGVVPRTAGASLSLRDDLRRQAVDMGSAFRELHASMRQFAGAAPCMPTMESIMAFMSRGAQGGSMSPEVLSPWERLARAWKAHETEVTRTREGQAHGGYLGDEATRRRLADRFGHEAVFSVAQFSVYRQCPYKYFLRYLIAPRQVEELTDELEANELGEIYHRVLRRAYADVRDVHSATWRQGVTEKLETWLNEAWLSVGSANRHAGRDAVMRERALRAMRTWWESEQQYLDTTDGNFLPRYLEWSFGTDGGMTDESDPASTPDPVRVGSLLMRGRVDRIDVDAEDRFVLYDYKSRRAPSIRSKQPDLQLPLYAAAVQGGLLHDGQAVGAFYSTVERPRRAGLVRDLASTALAAGSRSSVDDTQWEEWVNAAIASAESMRDAMKEGKFPVTPRDATHCVRDCEYRHVCRLDAGSIQSEGEGER